MLSDGGRWTDGAARKRAVPDRRQQPSRVNAGFTGFTGTTGRPSHYLTGWLARPSSRGRLRCLVEPLNYTLHAGERRRAAADEVVRGLILYPIPPSRRPGRHRVRQSPRSTAEAGPPVPRGRPRAGQPAAKCVYTLPFSLPLERASLTSGNSSHPPFRVVSLKFGFPLAR